MGICQPCMNSVEEVHANEIFEKRPLPQKVRPLLANLEADFEAFAGDDGVLDCKELAEIWKKCAMRKVGKLSVEDVALIEKSSRDLFDSLDIKKDGKVSYDEFVTYMMGGMESRGPLHEMRAHLDKQLNEDPELMSKLIEKFKSWDVNGDGVVTPIEFEEHLAELQKELGTCSPEEAQAKAHDMGIEIFKEADVDGDGQLDMWELIAHTLGRRKMPVEVLLYDVSHGMAEKLGSVLLGRKVIAAHSGIMVFGSEYWYGGQLFRSEPPCSRAFGPPLQDAWGMQLVQSEARPELPVIRCGYTFVSQAEFSTWLKTSGIVHRYSNVSQYDLLTHSCHHFCDEILKYLTGDGMPKKVMELQRMAATPTMMLLRPVLNKVMGGFGDAGKALDANFLSNGEASSTPDAQDLSVFKDLFSEGKVVQIPNMDGTDVVGTIIKEVDGVCDIRYFDPSTGQIAVKSGVNSRNLKELKCEAEDNENKNDNGVDRGGGGSR